MIKINIKQSKFIHDISNKDFNDNNPDKTENSHEKTNSDKHNTEMHSKNGNLATKILQVNKSNSNWETKQHELLHTIKENEAK